MEYSLLVGNIHKWMFAPRGCGFLWVPPRYHDVIKPLVVSWLHDGSFQDKFFMQATLDYTSYITAETAIKFYNEIGGLVRWNIFYDNNYQKSYFFYLPLEVTEYFGILNCKINVISNNNINKK